MLSSLRNFSKSKVAGVFVAIIILPFVFWGMGGVFSGGNTNIIAKINKTNITTQEFIDYLNNSGIPQKTIRDNLDENIIEELLSNLISTTLLNLEIEDYDFIISEKTLSKKIKENKRFMDENGNFQRLKYEKFLLENNLSAPGFEERLKNRELQKNLFDYVGAGSISPKFLINKFFIEENKKLDLEFINLKNFYKKKENLTQQDLENFVNENKDQLKIEYIDFDYAIINPKNLLGLNEFNQAFFDKIDEIEIDISNEVSFKTIVNNLNIEYKNVKNFKFSKNKNKIEKKIFDLRDNRFDIFENDNDYILYKVNNVNQKSPDLNEEDTKDEILELVSQKYKFEYNSELLKQIQKKEFNNNKFLEMGKNIIERTKLNSIKDNNKFEIDSVKTLYSLPVNSFTLITDDKNNIYLAKVKKFHDITTNINKDDLRIYTDKQSSNSKNSLLKSYDLLLNDKYNVTLNNKTIERVKNFFQ
ncbi:SurA N-terminal domain-containing protein [Candidatus Pelagibacter sp.]|nr:SurA N-terminal domain-containing protein [Candidatus Pelagibacter sp.]